jgi:predicted ABC-type transport system involved in lysophospholipase L1 biosynthesis ATPase subunit
MVTHDERLANQAQRIVRLSEGRIQAHEEAA